MQKTFSVVVPSLLILTLALLFVYPLGMYLRTLYLSPTSGRSLNIRLQTGQALHLNTSNGWYIYTVPPMRKSYFYLMNNPHAPDGSCINGVAGGDESLPRGAIGVREQTVAFNPHLCQKVSERGYIYSHR